jgi:hypothetical protein
MGATATFAGWVSLATVLVGASSLIAMACSAGTCPAGDTCARTCGPNAACPGTDDGGPDAAAEAGTDEDAMVDGGYPEGSVAPTASSVAVLDYRVIDADFSRALSSIVMVSDAPSNALHIYDTTTGVDRKVVLPFVPVAVSVSPADHSAAVAFEGHVVWFDLDVGVATDTCDLSGDAQTIALSASGTAFVAPRSSQPQVALHAIEQHGCAQRSLGGFDLASRLRVHPLDQAIFFSTRDQYTAFDRCLPHAPGAVCGLASDPRDMHLHSLCADFWLSADGLRMFTACGIMLGISGDGTAGFLSYEGELPGVLGVQHLVEVPGRERIALVPSAQYKGTGLVPSPNDDTVIRVHEAQSSKFLTQYELPTFPAGGGTPAHGRFVYATPSMDRFFAVVTAGPAAGAHDAYAIATITP